MIRDITLGQYYPVDSVIHRMDPRIRDNGIHHFPVPFGQHRDLCDRHVISGDVHPVVQSAIFLYGAGIEGHCVPAFDQCQL